MSTLAVCVVRPCQRFRSFDQACCYTDSALHLTDDSQITCAFHYSSFAFLINL